MQLTGCAYSRLLDKGLTKPVCPTHQEAVTGRSLDFRARLWGGGVKPVRWLCSSLSSEVVT